MPRQELNLNIYIFTPSELWTLLIMSLLIFKAWRNKFFIGTRALLTCPSDQRYSYDDFGDGCISWFSWSIRCSFSCCGTYNATFSSLLILFSVNILSTNWCLVLMSCCWSFQVVGSRNWPLVSRYRAAVRTQSPKVEMIDGLYKPLPNGDDDGIIRYRKLKLWSSPVNHMLRHIVYVNTAVTEISVTFQKS